MDSKTFEAKEAPYLNVQTSFYNAFPWERAHHDQLRDLKKPLFIKSSFLTSENAPISAADGCNTDLLPMASLGFLRMCVVQGGTEKTGLSAP